MNLAAIPCYDARIARFARGLRRLFALAAASSRAALAQEDLPGRVGRVADVAGELFIAPQDRPDAWAPSALNYPVASGDNLWVGNDGRAEVDFGGRQLRLAGDTNLHVSRLDDRQFALFVAQGRVSIRVRVLEPGETARVDTPNAQVTITRPGPVPHRRERRSRAHALVVREGEANVQTAGALQQVLPGQSADVDGAESALRDRAATASASTASTRGSPTAIAAIESRPSGGYVSPQMVGAADLDAIRVVDAERRVRRRLVSERRRRRLGAVSQRLLGRRRRLGPDVGRLRALGLRAVPLRPLGVRRRPLGLGSGQVRRASVVGACARRAGRAAPGWGISAIGRRPGVRLGAAGLGRAVPPVVGPLLVRLLGPLQPAVRGEHQRVAPEQPAADVVSQLECAERRHRGVGLGVLRAPARAAESRARFARAGGDRARVVERAADARRAEPRCIPASRERAASGIVVPADVRAADAAASKRHHDARPDDDAHRQPPRVAERLADRRARRRRRRRRAFDATRRQPALAVVCAADVADATAVVVRATAVARRAAAGATRAATQSARSRRDSTDARRAAAAAAGQCSRSSQCACSRSSRCQPRHRSRRRPSRNRRSSAARAPAAGARPRAAGKPRVARAQAAARQPQAAA